MQHTLIAIHLWLLVTVFFGIGTQRGLAQQIAISTPMTAVSNGYFERQGVSFGGSFGSVPANGSGSIGFFSFGGGGFAGPAFSQNSFGSTLPQLGGFDPASAARFGFGNFNSNGGRFGLNFEMGKGSSRSLTSVAPGVTVQNGFGGSIGSAQFRPFVTSVTPVIGSYPAPIENAVTLAVASGKLDLSGLGQRDGAYAISNGNEPAVQLQGESTATRSAASVRSIRQRKAAERVAVRKKIDEMLAAARSDIASDQYGQARIKLKRALAMETDPQFRSEIVQLLNSTGK